MAVPPVDGHGVEYGEVRGFFRAVSRHAGLHESGGAPRCQSDHVYHPASSHRAQQCGCLHPQHAVTSYRYWDNVYLKIKYLNKIKLSSFILFCMPVKNGDTMNR